MHETSFHVVHVDVGIRNKGLELRNQELGRVSRYLMELGEARPLYQLEHRLEAVQEALAQQPHNEGLGFRNCS